MREPRARCRDDDDPDGHTTLRRSERHMTRNEIFRGITAVIVGYMVIAVFVAITFSLTWWGLGRSFAFTRGTTDVTIGWMAIALVLGFIGATIGGMAARSLAPQHSRIPVEILAGLVLVIGFLSAAAQRGDARPESFTPQQPAEISVLEAASKTWQPPWFSFLVPFVGALGVRLGGSVRHQRRTASET